jgi:L-aspartate oxidase
MGGVATDVDGRASLDGLLAVGECACSGLHGANRLASNSLADCFVFGRRAALAALGMPNPPAAPGEPPPPGPSPAPPPPTRAALWRKAGLERDPEALATLVDDPFPLASLIASSALARTESRGAHRRRDRPDTDPALDRMHAVVRGEGELAFERWV